MRHPIYNVFLISLLFVLFTLYFRDWDDIETVKYCILIMLLDVTVFFMYQQKSNLKNFWYKPSNIFLLSFVVVNYQRAADLCLGYKTYDMLACYTKFNKAIILSTFSLIIFTISYINTKKKLAATRVNENTKITRRKNIKIDLLVLFQIISFILWVSTENIFLIMAGKDYSSGYISNFEVLHYFSIIAILITVISNSQENLTLKQFFKKIPLISWIFLAVYLIVRVVSGDRGPLIFTLSAFFFSFVYVSKNKIPTKFIVVAVIGMAFFINIVGIARSYDKNKDFGDRLYEGFLSFTTSDEARFSEKTISPLTEELSGSYKCNTIAIEIIENNHDVYHKGAYFGYGLLHCIPFVPSFLSNVLNIPPHEQLSDILFTDYYVGRHDLYQIGSNFIADSYMDLGVIGVLFMLILVGWSFKKIDLIICLKYKTHFLFLLLCILISSYSVYIPRSTFVSQIKNVIPIFVLLFINKIFNKLYEK